MKKDYEKLKNVFSGDSETLRLLEAQEQTQLLKEIASKKISFDGVEAIKGDPGHTPTDEELLNLITPLIPNPIPGENGHTPTKEEILKLVKPLIPQVEDGHTPTKDELLFIIKPLIPDPIPGKDGQNTSPLEVIEEIKNLSGEAEKDFSIKVGKKIDISHIRNANSFLFNGKRVKFEELMHGGGSSGSTGVQTVTGLNTDNTDPLNPIVKISVDGTSITGQGTPVSPLVATNLGTVTTVSATAPITSSGGTTPDISTSMATNKLIGRGTAGTGVMEQITLGTNLSFSGTTLNAAGGSMAIGGTVTSGTAGSVLFIGSGPVLAQDNTNFFWDDSLDNLGLGNTAPLMKFDTPNGGIKFGKVPTFFDVVTDNPLTSGATTINADGTTGYPSSGYLLLDTELISYTGITASSFTGCTRGVLGTSAASHVVNTIIDPCTLVSPGAVFTKRFNGFGVVKPTASMDVFYSNANIGDVLLRVGSNNLSGQFTIKDQTQVHFGYGLDSGNLAMGVTSHLSEIYDYVNSTGNKIQFWEATNNNLTISSGFGGDILINPSGIIRMLSDTLKLDATGKVSKYGNVVTTGWGVPAIYGSGRSTAQTAAVASVATYTVGAADGSFEVSANVLVTTSTVHNFTATVAYTDEGNTARTVTLQFSTLAGTFVTAMTNAQGTVPYEGVPLHIRCKASTAITIATTGTFTTVTYNVEGIIRQLS